jgi:hypothetical protein
VGATVRAVQKTVYYCGHCGKHGLSRPAMEKHERVCTLNPERVCRWKIDDHGYVEVAAVAAELRERASSYPLSPDPESEERTYLAKDDVEWLRDEVDGCPACMLAAMRQSGVDDYHTDRRGAEIFNYQAEVDRVRADERAFAREDVW